MTPRPHPIDAGGAVQVRGDVAIVGMACTFPGARNLQEFWRNVVNGVDAVTEVPPQRWDPNVYYDPSAEGKIYCKRGGYLGTSFSFNPLKWGTMPRAVEGAEPEQFLVLRTVHEALRDAGCLDNRRLPGERTAVLLGRGNYLGAGVTGLVQRGMITEQTLQILQSLHPEFTPQDIAAIRRELQATLPSFSPDSAPGLIPNIIGGRVANRLDLMGPTFTIDAACASSLIATEIAVRGLLTGQFDAVLAGGVHLFADVSFLHVFCAMGALSRTSVIRPFDRDCDGTLAGEGVGLLVLKRLADAQRNGDRVYAVIKGVGTSSDGKAMGVTAPRLEGETLALLRAYEMAGFPPQTVGLIEAHGTGTPIGDETELAALRSVFGTRSGRAPSIALGSVKSMIGHAMPAAGAAAMIKTALSLYHGVLPATLNCRNPHDALRRDDSRFYVNSRTRPWIHSDSHPRRAGVNAFGFGGVNAHVVLEEHSKHHDRSTGGPGAINSKHEGNKDESVSRETRLRDWDCELLIVEGGDRQELVANCRSLHDYALQGGAVSLRDIAYTLNTAPGHGPHRLAVIASSLTDLAEKLVQGISRLADPACNQIKDSKGIYYLHESPGRGAKLAFLFPGLGAQYTNLMADLCVHFPEVRACFESADRTIIAAVQDKLSADIFPPPAFSKAEADAAELHLSKIERANPAVMTANGAMFLLMDRLGVRADMMTGHSSGEWVVMPAAGMVSVDEFVSSMSKLGEMWRSLGENAAVPHQVMLAVGADRETVARLAAEIDRPIQVANDNCKHQVVVVVRPDAAELVMDRLRARGIFVDRLPYDHGYHTREFTFVTDSLREYFSSMAIRPPKVKLYSCTTAKPYPVQTAEVVDLLANTFARPLLFRDTIEAMYADGARVFVELGPRGNLTAFVDDILRGRPHVAIATNHHAKSGLMALQHALAQLAALHVPMDLASLYECRSARLLTLDPAKDRPADEANEPGTVQVSLCCPRLQLSPEAARTFGAKLNKNLAQAAGGEGPTGAGEEPPVAQSSASATPPGTDLRRASIHPAAHSNMGSGRDAVMQQHFRLMEEWLQTNADIMQAMLGQSLAPMISAPLGAPSAPLPGAASSDSTVPQALPLSSATRDSANVVCLEPRPVSPDVAGVSAGPLEGSHQASSAPVRRIADVLLAIVTDRTGYPPEMLDLDLDMEADLGIDSIKRVEILGALQSAGEPSSSAVEMDMEEVAKLKTLRQIVAFLEQTAAGGAASPGSRALESQPRIPAASTRVSSSDRTSDPNGATQDEVAWSFEAAARLPLSGTVMEHIPGTKIVLRRVIDARHDLYLHDHCFDPYISDVDTDRERLCIVPLTVSLEMMAETATLLDPGRRIVSARNVQAGKWIEVEPGGPRVEIEITAARRSQSEVQASIRFATSPAESSTSTLAEAVFTFAEAFPAAPIALTLELSGRRMPANTARQMYDERRMFHGPQFRGVASIDAVGENGLLARLEVLPMDKGLRDCPRPAYCIDPFLLDAAGQLVGYWPVEYLSEGFVLFPIRIQELTLYRENLTPGGQAECRLRVVNVGKRQLRADMDIIAPDGSLWMRITGWEDWRFYWDPDFYNFWRYPNLGIVSSPLQLPLPDGSDVECRRMAPFGEMGSSMWENLWAHLILCRRELSEYRAMSDGARRTQWIFGRAAAKDAVRTWIRRHYGLAVYPADVDISQDEFGKPSAGGYWVSRIGEAPEVSISHKGHVAVAAAGRTPVGIDLETIAGRDSGFESLAFDERERSIITKLNGGTQRDEWVTRAWCAKEAAGKAAGNGLRFNPRNLAVLSIDPADGRIVVACGAESSEPRQRECQVHSVRDGEFIIALALMEKTCSAAVGSK